MTTHYVYMLKCRDQTIYTGYTTNIQRRLNEHNSSSKGAKYTRGRRPVILIYFKMFSTKSEALKHEHQLKKIKRHEKEKLIKLAQPNLINVQETDK